MRFFLFFRIGIYLLLLLSHIGLKWKNSAVMISILKRLKWTFLDFFSSLRLTLVSLFCKNKKLLTKEFFTKNYETRKNTKWKSLILGQFLRGKMKIILGVILLLIYFVALLLLFLFFCFLAKNKKCKKLTSVLRLHRQPLCSKKFHKKLILVFEAKQWRASLLHFFRILA